MKLIKVSESETEYIDKGLFKRGEKGLQTLISRNLKTIFGCDLLGNEVWVDYGDLSLAEIGQKKIDGRIDTLGMTDKGVPVIVEYKERKGKQILKQTLSYMAWLFAKPGQLKDFLDFQKDAGIIDPLVNPDFSYKPKMVMVAEDYDVRDFFAAAMVRDDIELYFKRYELFSGQSEKYLHIFDAAQPERMIKLAKSNGDNKSRKQTQDIGSLNGFFINRHGLLVPSKHVSLTGLPQSIDAVIEKEAKKLFGISTFSRKIKTDNGMIQGAGLEDNGRLSLIIHTPDEKNMIEYAMLQAEWSKEHIKSINSNEINWGRKDHRIILVCDHDLSLENKDLIERLENTKGNIMDIFNFEPRWLTHYALENEHYLMVGRTALHSQFHTYPGKNYVYSVDMYTREFRDPQKMLPILKNLRKGIMNLGKEIDEGFYNKSGITYSCPNKFVVVQPKKEYISIALTKEAKIDSLPEHMKVKESKRFHVYEMNDVLPAIELIKKIYQEKHHV